MLTRDEVIAVLEAASVPFYVKDHHAGVVVDDRASFEAQDIQWDFTYTEFNNCDVCVSIWGKAGLDEDGAPLATADGTYDDRLDNWPQYIELKKAAEAVCVAAGWTVVEPTDLEAIPSVEFEVRS